MKEWKKKKQKPMFFEPTDLSNNGKRDLGSTRRKLWRSEQVLAGKMAEGRVEW